MAVIELASFQKFSDLQQDIIKEATPSIGVAINNLNNQGNTQALLEKTQQQADELKTQQEKLKSANESLQEQAEILRSTEEELGMQGAELKHAHRIRRKNLRLRAVVAGLILLLGGYECRLCMRASSII